MKEFRYYNPYIILVYFIFVTSVSMLVMNPAILVISSVASIMYSVVLSGFRNTLRRLFALIPIVVITALVNPLFNHSGVTVLCYFPSGNPLTAEAVIYGAFSGLMLLSVIMWFSCFNFIFKSDKILYVAGKIAPAVSMVLSMSLRFVPRFVNRISELARVQRTFGKSAEKGRLSERMKTASAIMHSVTGWSMENAVETVEAMKSKGFGTGKRCAFSIYKFDGRDAVMMTFLLATAVVVLVFSKELWYSYYPEFDFSAGVVAPVAYGVLCFVPAIIDFTEDMKWR